MADETPDYIVLQLNNSVYVSDISAVKRKSVKNKLDSEGLKNWMSRPLQIPCYTQYKNGALICPA